jgi:NAD(P)-dependent dehydrogenase (short-subunit alcohol dehydrogenase family)
LLDLEAHGNQLAPPRYASVQSRTFGGQEAFMTRTALIVGAGSGISASFARLLAKDGYRVALASRDPAKLTRFAAETKATTHPCDAADPASVDRLFAHIDHQFPKLDVCLFNASARAPGPIIDVDREQARTALLISSYGGFLVAQAAAHRTGPARSC